MSARACIPWPDKRLRTAAADVDGITDEIRTIWDDMIDTMEAMPGVGLAAPQVGVMLLTDTVVQVRGAMAELLQPGDRLLTVGGAPVRGIATLVEATLAEGQLPVLTVDRGGQTAGRR